MKGDTPITAEQARETFLNATERMLGAKRLQARRSAEWGVANTNRDDANLAASEAENEEVRARKAWHDAEMREATQ